MTDLTLMPMEDFFREFAKAVRQNEMSLSHELIRSRHADRLSEHLLDSRQELLRRMGGDSPENQELLSRLKDSILVLANDKHSLTKTYAHADAKRDVLDRIKKSQKLETAEEKD